MPRHNNSSWPCGVVVAYLLWVQVVQGSSPCSAQTTFIFSFLCYLVGRVEFGLLVL
jgi:hypothetical protein